MSTQKDAFARDKSYVFKFEKGDRVKKAWRWMKRSKRIDDDNTYCRYGGDSDDVPIGSIGTVEIVKKDGTVCVRFDNGHEWMLGASELDYAPASVGTARLHNDYWMNLHRRDDYLLPEAAAEVEAHAHLGEEIANPTPVKKKKKKTIEALYADPTPVKKKRKRKTVETEIRNDLLQEFP